MKIEINQYKTKIQKRINKELKKFNFFADYTYHFLVGIIIVGLLLVDLISGLLFFFYALFRTLVSKTSERNRMFSDLEIYENIEIERGSIFKYVLASAALSGTIAGLIINFFYPENLQLLFLFYSFISGVILYMIVREIIPEKEKGDPIRFLIGLTAFSIIIFIINLFTNFL